MNETQLIASNRLDKLEDLVEGIREYAGERFYEDEYHLMDTSQLLTITKLMELSDLCDVLIREVAKKRLVSQEV